METTSTQIFRVRVLDHPRTLQLDTIWFLERTHCHWHVPSASNGPFLRFRKGIACTPSSSISALAPALTRSFSGLREGPPMPPCFPPRSSRHRPASYGTAARNSVSSALLSVSAWRRARRLLGGRARSDRGTYMNVVYIVRWGNQRGTAASWACTSVLGPACCCSS